jgi:hypothetical protein
MGVMIRDEKRLIPVSDQLPPLRERVMVVCDGFRCRGYLAEGGIWRYGSDDSPIEEPVIGWVGFD